MPACAWLTACIRTRNAPQPSRSALSPAPLISRALFPPGVRRPRRRDSCTVAIACWRDRTTCSACTSGGCRRFRWPRRTAVHACGSIVIGGHQPLDAFPRLVIDTDRQVMPGATLASPGPANTSTPPPRPWPARHAAAPAGARGNPAPTHTPRHPDNQARADRKRLASRGFRIEQDRRDAHALPSHP
jgi:hypothetical protein